MVPVVGGVRRDWPDARRVRRGCPGLIGGACSSEAVNPGLTCISQTLIEISGTLMARMTQLVARTS